MNYRFILPAAIVAVLMATATAQAQQEAPAAAPAAPTAPGPKLSPEQQVTAFYAACKANAVGSGLEEMLKANPFVKEEDLSQIKAGFERLVIPMGAFIDFEILKKDEISKRTVNVRCVAHFQKQPFVNEFMFYDPGNGEWRLVHLRYDSNVATMFVPFTE